MADSNPRPSTSSYIVILSGTHVTGKETLAINLAKSFGVPWVRGENAGSSAYKIARAHENRGGTSSEVQKKYGEAWFVRVQRMGLLADVPMGGERTVSPNAESKRLKGGCLAVVTCYAMRSPDRIGIHEVMAKRSVRTLFVILQISKEILPGRTLGAEEPELAERIIKQKLDDLDLPSDAEIDSFIVDALLSVDDLTAHVEKLVGRQVAQ